MAKKDLLKEAEDRGITGLTDKNTVKEIEAALAAAPTPADPGTAGGSDDPVVTPQGEVDDNNVDEAGTVIGTEVEPQTETVNAKADPHPDYPEGSSHRHAERFGDGAVLSTTSEDGKTLTWTDPDAVPGTIGDDPEETMRALAAAGSPSVKVEGS